MTALFYTTKEAAAQAMRGINRTKRAAGRVDEMVVLVDGPEDNWAVVDLETAVELGGGYEWEV